MLAAMMHFQNPYCLNFMARSLMLVVLLLLTQISQAQVSPSLDSLGQEDWSIITFDGQSGDLKDSIDVIGTVKDRGTQKALGGASVTLMLNGDTLTQVQTDFNGTFSVFCYYDEEFEVIFSKPHYFEKRIVVDARNIPVFEKKRGWFQIPLELSLVSSTGREKELDDSVHREPVGGFRYDSAEEDFMPYFNSEVGRVDTVKEPEIAPLESHVEAEIKPRPSEVELETKPRPSEVELEETGGYLLPFLVTAMILAAMASLAIILPIRARRKAKFERENSRKNDGFGQP